MALTTVKLNFSVMRKIKVIVLIVGLLFGMDNIEYVIAGTGHVDHTAWSILLRKYVSTDGVVNYREMKKEEDVLNAYIEKLGKDTPEKTWGENEKLTYWINLYNASTVSLILKNYPLKSIREIDKPWDIVFVKAGDKEYSLNDIEHEIIRKEFDEPRIHFALVCAAKSCPPLLNEAYNADKLNAQLHQQGVKFINNPKKNEIAVDNIKVSKLFDWYKGDFTKKVA